VFAINSNEAIWQVASAASGVIQTTEGYLFVPAATSVSVPVYAVSTQLYSAFEASDKRRANWMGPKIVNGQTYYYPYKYKVSSSATVKEYYMMFRFAEQYLVRAEARVQQQNIGGAMQDIDSLRKRAGVPLLVNTDPGINQPAMLAAVEQERRRELCFEWGHRWLDLKRSTGFNDVAKTRADEVLEPLKSNWKSTNVLYPVPESERNLNPYLVQNKGYE
jgi:hypothetical protein